MTVRRLLSAFMGPPCFRTRRARKRPGWRQFHIQVTLQCVVALSTCLTLHAQQRAPAALERAVSDRRKVAIVQAISGDEAEGRLISVTPTTLSLLIKNQQFDVPLQSISRVDAIGDPLSNGALIGAVVMGIACAVLCGQGLSDADQLPLAIGANAGWGALIGAAMDWSQTSRKTIYSSPAIQPPVARSAGRVMSFRFHFGSVKSSR